MRLRQTACALTIFLTLALAGAAAPARAETAQDQPPDAAALIDSALALAAKGQSVEALEKAEDAYFAVWDRLPLGFRRIELIDDRPEGYDRIDPRESHAYDPDQNISIYVDPIGFGWRRAKDGWQTDLTADFILATEEGRIIAGQKDFANFDIRSPQRAHESFLVINYRFTGVPPGDYVLTTTVHDRVEDETASFDMPITIN